MNGQRNTETVSLSLPPSHLKVIDGWASKFVDRGMTRSQVIKLMVEELSAHEFCFDGLFYYFKKREGGNA